MTGEYGTGWCPECRRTRGIEDQFPESRYEKRGEVEFMVDVFDCGHTNERGEHVVGAAPGAPYAGPQAVIAASTRPADMRAARAEQGLPEVVDPWL